MCCCGKPTINGEVGYRWNQPDAAPSVYPVNPPTLQDGDVLLFDEPGRCGGLDSHSHHFRFVLNCGAVYVLYRHGGGEGRFRFGWKKTTTPALECMDSNGRYWIACAAFHGLHDAVRDARETEAATWRKAAAEGRLKTRKQRGENRIKVWIEQPTLALQG